uniref:Uncharacterized protein n=1 Tax=Timema cristinae TaxID=61476 RepID=A0A7R9DJ61_TIMCR|nr:unnamed protein product [Timema cristinae]
MKDESDSDIDSSSESCELDFTSTNFNPSKVLRSVSIQIPCPNAPIFDNIHSYASRHIHHRHASKQVSQLRLKPTLVNNRQRLVPKMHHNRLVASCHIRLYRSRETDGAALIVRALGVLGLTLRAVSRFRAPVLTRTVTGLEYERLHSYARGVGDYFHTRNGRNLILLHKGKSGDRTPRAVASVSGMYVKQPCCDSTERQT